MSSKPSIGRIVRFCPGKDGPQKEGDYPAVITHVFSEFSVNLSVLQDGTFPLPDSMLSPTSVTHFSETERSEEAVVPFWYWPPRD